VFVIVNNISWTNAKNVLETTTKFEDLFNSLGDPGSTPDILNQSEVKLELKTVRDLINRQPDVARTLLRR
jgi:hypothetical protein